MNYTKMLIEKNKKLKKESTVLKLKDKFNEVAKAYIEQFCEKQGLDYNYSISDDLGNVSCFSNEWFINFDDIRLDIDSKAPKGEILKWHDESMDAYEKNNKNINYKSWLMGLRYDT